MRTPDGAPQRVPERDGCGVDVALTLQAFFVERLIRKRQLSPHTIAAYRDTLRRLLTFAGDAPLGTKMIWPG